MAVLLIIRFDIEIDQLINRPSTTFYLTSTCREYCTCMLYAHVTICVKYVCLCL